jgi:hypothetical protein
MLHTLGLTKPWSFIPHITLFDDAVFDYCVCFPNNLSFEEHFKVELIETVNDLGAGYNTTIFYAIV